jgi:integrase
LEVLKRCFSLALQHSKIFTKPHIEMLKEAAPRAGFLGREQVDAICGHLSPELAAVIRFGFITGWRIPSEVLTLEWRQVDFKAGCVRLEPGTTKNDEAREFRFTAELRSPARRAMGGT